MSIKDDVVTALAGVALDAYGEAKVFPHAAPQDVALPLVIVKRIRFEPEHVLEGSAGIAKSTFVLECWGKTEDEASSLALAVSAAIDADSNLPLRFLADAEGEDYEPEPDEYVEPVYYSFWHED